MPFWSRLVSFFPDRIPRPHSGGRQWPHCRAGAFWPCVAMYRWPPTTPSARIGLNEVAIGLRFPPALLRFVRSTVGPQHINEVVLGAGLHSPEDALRLGLVDAVDADPVAAASARLRAYAKHPSDAYAATKQDLREGVMQATDAENTRFQKEVVPFWTSLNSRPRFGPFWAVSPAAFRAVANHTSPTASAVPSKACIRAATCLNCAFPGWTTINAM